MNKKHTSMSLAEDFDGFATSERRRAREAALVMLYQLDFGDNTEQIAEQTINSLGLMEENAAFAWQLVKRARSLKAVSDELIAEHSREWDFERLFNIDVTILRLAFGELNSTTPTSIVINEAIELAKKFGDGASPAFVNAVLDAVNQISEEKEKKKTDTKD